MVLADLRRGSGRQLRECSRRQGSAVLASCGFGSDWLSARQLSRLRLPRPNRSYAVRNRTRENCFLCRTNLRRRPTRASGDVSSAARNCPHRSRRGSGEFGVTLDRRHRSSRFVWHRMHLRQRVTQVLANAHTQGACLPMSVPMPLSEKDNRSPRSCESVNVSRYFALVFAKKRIDQVASLQELPLMSGEK